MFAHAERPVGQVALESTSPGFQPGATPSQRPTHRIQRKKPDVAVTSGFEDWLSAGCHKRRGYTGSEFAGCSAKHPVLVPLDMQLGRK